MICYFNRVLDRNRNKTKKIKTPGRLDVGSKLEVSLRLFEEKE